MKTKRRRVRYGRGVSLAGKVGAPGRCQVGSETEHPCLRPAVAEIQDVPFCKRCAREQEAYFTVGEITQELTEDRTKRAWYLLDERLVETLHRMRWEFTGRTGEEERRMEIVKR